MVTALTIKNDTLTILDNIIPITNGFIHLSWEELQRLNSSLNKAHEEFTDSLDFIHNNNVTINDIGKVNNFWFDLHKILSDAWFEGMSVEEFQTRYNNLVEAARA